MNKEMTAEEYKEKFDNGLLAFASDSLKTYGDLRAKEAVKPFLDGLLKLSILLNKDQKNISDEAKILLNELIQKGVEI